MAEAVASINEVKDLGMIQIRADLDASGNAIAAATGLAMPGQTRIVSDGARSLGWMSPDELLLTLPLAEVAATLEALEAGLAGQHALVVDVSDMRAVFDVTGPRAAEALAKLAPVDFAMLPADGLRRTRLAQVACGLWPIAGGYRVIGFRSVRDYMRVILDTAARPGTTLAAR